MTDPDNSLDILGIKPVADAINTVTKASTDGAGAFLSKICLPAAEEFGLLLRDQVKAWRAKNAVAIAVKAEVLYERLPKPNGRHAHPRVVGAVIEHGSWCDESDVQGMWAGLLASACSETGHAQENLIFINLLGQITTAEARILNFACESARKQRSVAGLIITPDELIVSLANVAEISGRADIHTIDLEIDHLREIGLLVLASGINVDSGIVHLTPSNIALQLYVRCHGYVGSPLEFFGL